VRGVPREGGKGGKGRLCGGGNIPAPDFSGSTVDLDGNAVRPSKGGVYERSRGGAGSCKGVRVIIEFLMDSCL